MTVGRSEVSAERVKTCNPRHGKEKKGPPQIRPKVTLGKKNAPRKTDNLSNLEP